MLCLGIRFPAAAEPAGNQIGAGCATAVAGQPHDSVIRIDSIVLFCKMILQRIVHFHGSLAEAVVLRRISHVEVTEPLGIFRGALDGNGVDSVGFIGGRIVNILIRNGISHIITVIDGQFSRGSIVHGGIVIVGKAHLGQQACYIILVISRHRQRNGRLCHFPRKHTGILQQQRRTEPNRRFAHG